MATQTASHAEQHQATFALSFFANSVRTTTGKDLGPVAYALITEALAKSAGTIGKWEIVWGPATYSQPFLDAYRMNTMYLARSVARPNQYVLAMAGTNPYSLLSWIAEDGFVHTQVPWVYARKHAPGAKISLGTAIGLHIQQTFRPDAGLPGAGETLTEHLRKIDWRDVHIAVAGHSLGGALSPAIALWLADTQGIPLLWDPRKHATISCLPTAGPTAGNGAFARYAVEKLGSGLTPFYNSIDVVPHAWAASGTPSLDPIKTLYAPDIEPFDTLNTLVGVAEKLSAKGDYTHFAGLSAFGSTVNKDLIKPGNLPIKNFLAQLGYQHVPAYFPVFGFDPAWVPKEPEPRSDVHPSLAQALAEGRSPADVVSAMQSRDPGKLPIGGALVDAPRGPDDPQAARVVELLVAELEKQGGSSSAG